MTVAPGTAVIVCGVGEDGAPVLERALRRHRPSALLQFGLAGALDPSLACGSGVGVDRWHDLEPPHRVVETSDPDLTDRLLDLARDEPPEPDAGGGPPILGPLHRTAAVTVGEPLHGISRRDALRRATGASIVEMEGAHWTSRARDLSVPSTALRVISDHADRRLPLPRHLLFTAAGEVRWARWIWSLAVSNGWRRPIGGLRDLLRARDDWSAAMAGLGSAADLVSRVAAGL